MPVPPPKTKTYTREIYRLFTQDEVRSLFKEAHDHCKQQVKRTVHRTPKGRTVFRRDKTAYLNCIKSYIDSKVQERARELGALG
jgi:hypothetical protein